MRTDGPAIKQAPSGSVPGERGAARRGALISLSNENIPLQPPIIITLGRLFSTSVSTRGSPFVDALMFLP